MIIKIYRIILPLVMVAVASSGCDLNFKKTSEADTAQQSALQTIPTDTTTYTDDWEIETVITLPIVNVFFADSTFVESVAEVLKLTDEEIAKLRSAAQRSVTEMRERGEGDGYAYRTGEARLSAEQTISEILGEERGEELIDLIRLRWNGAGSDYIAQDSEAAVADSAVLAETKRRSAAGAHPGNIPNDTRIVVNIPAYRMDLFKGGKLVASQKIAVGYPEFPLPIGERSAREIIFNPTWTPPDESWVNSSKSVKAGKTISAGSEQNPLGIAKIPIGLPSLIHGGKSSSVIGGFGSHGCVGLTDNQLEQFLLHIAEATGTDLDAKQVGLYKKNRAKTKSLPLAFSLPVELRYETILIVGDELHIYRDIYDYNTNTEQNLRRVLASYGVSLDQLDEPTRQKIVSALKSMAKDAQGETDSEDPVSGDTASSKKTQKKITRKLKGGEKMVAVKLPLNPKEGYPKMLEEKAM